VSIIRGVGQLAERYKDLPLRIEIDDRAVSVSSRLKSAHEDYVPHKIVIGQKELDDNFSQLDILVNDLAAEMSGKPFIRREWPIELSGQF